MCGRRGWQAITTTGRGPGERAGTNVPKNRSLIIIGGRGWALEPKRNKAKKLETWKQSKTMAMIANHGMVI